MKEDPSENLQLVDQQVSKLLHNLPRVGSPGDFEAKIRSRIANSKSVPERKWLVPTFASASLLVLLSFGFIFWLSGDSADLVASQPPTEVVDSVPTSPFAQPNTVVDKPTDPTPANIPIAGREIAAERRRIATRSDVRNRSNSRPPTESPEDGSEVRLLTPAPTINANVGSTARVLLKDYFPMIGVDASFENNAWVVRNVAPETIASRIGVIQGDIVESIGSVRLAEITTLDGRELENKITVRRGNELKTLERRKP